MESLGIAINQYLGSAYKNFPYIAMERHIQNWLAWYKGNVEGFHNFKTVNGTGKAIEQHRQTLNMGKRVPEDWASLLMNEKVTITVDDNSANDYVQEVLKNNRFTVESNRLTELTFALGTGAMIVGYDKERKKEFIDYIHGDFIFPLSWENGKITECAFFSKRTEDKIVYFEVVLHTLNEPNEEGLRTYQISKINVGDGVDYGIVGRAGSTSMGSGNYKEIDTFDSQSEIPYFTITKPHIVNNYDKTNPMGVSIIGNALSQIKGADAVYDSYYNEFILGIKRIAVSKDMEHAVKTDDGIEYAFDPSNPLYLYGIPFDEETGKPKFAEINMSLRTNEHQMALTDILKLISSQCGLGGSYYTLMKDMSVQTATAVVSERDDLFRNKKKHELLLHDNIIDVVEAIIRIANVEMNMGLKEDAEITVEFDDSIIQDDEVEYKQDYDLMLDGIMPKKKFLVKHRGLTEKEAKEWIADSEEEDEANDKFMFGDNPTPPPVEPVIAKEPLKTMEKKKIKIKKEVAND